MHLVRITGMCLFILITMPAHSATNKWIDEQGNVHYGDRVPAEFLDKEREVINDSGLVIKKHEKLKTKEEREKEKIKKEEQAKITKQKLIAERKSMLRDRVLTDTFTTERDILMARDRRIDAVTSQINLTETIIKDDEKKLSAIKKRISNIEKSGREVPENTKKSLHVANRQLENHYQFIETKTRERDMILSKFDKDIKRFRELKNKRNKK